MLNLRNNNKSNLLRSLGFIVCIASFALVSGTHAQDAKKQANPIGGGSGWDTEVQAGDSTNKPVNMDDETVAFVQTISDYFNNFSNMQGQFLQTDPEGNQAKGRFYVKRPGKLRFDYAPPSKLRIVADGRWLSIEDHDLKTIDRYPLESTPFRLLLAEKVDLLKDSRVVDISRGESVAIISVADKEDDGAGQLKLFFSIPELELLQWIITDPSGQDTKLEISNMILEKKKDDKFFDVADETTFSVTD